MHFRGAALRWPLDFAQGFSENRSADLYLMKRIIPFVLLLAACASPTAVIDKRSFRCGPGQDIEVRAGIVDPLASRESAGPMVYLLEIANNSHHDVTVKYIRLEPRGDTIDGATTVSRHLDQLIPEGKDHVFEIPVSDVWVSSRQFARRLDDPRVRFAATVTLANGDSYHCEFEARSK